MSNSLAADLQKESDTGFTNNAGSFDSKTNLESTLQEESGKGLSNSVSSSIGGNTTLNMSDNLDGVSLRDFLYSKSNLKLNSSTSLSEILINKELGLKKSSGNFIFLNSNDVNYGFDKLIKKNDDKVDEIKKTISELSNCIKDGYSLNVSYPLLNISSELKDFEVRLYYIVEAIKNFSNDSNKTDAFDNLVAAFGSEERRLNYFSTLGGDLILLKKWSTEKEKESDDSKDKKKESDDSKDKKKESDDSKDKKKESDDEGKKSVSSGAIFSTSGSSSALPYVQPRYSSAGSSSQTNLTQNNDTSANTSKNTFSSSDSKSNTSTSSTTTAPPSTTSTTVSPSTTSTTAPTPSTSQTTSTTILTPKNNSNSSSSQVHTGGGYSSSSGYTGTGDYNSDTSNATPSTPSTPETMAPGNTSKLSDEELTSIKNVIDNSKIHTTTIPKSNTPISSDTKSGGGGSSVIPISAGLTAAAAAGLGAKAYLDRKNNNDNGSSDEINTDEWTGDESVDIKYDDSSDNQEATLDADDDYTYQSSDENEKYDAKANNELTDLQ